LDQVEIIFSKLKRELLTPSDFKDLNDLKKQIKAYFRRLNEKAEIIKWTYTKAKMLAHFRPQPSLQKLVA
jgi:hypothetical protein